MSSELCLNFFSLCLYLGMRKMTAWFGFPKGGWIWHVASFVQCCIRLGSFVGTLHLRLVSPGDEAGVDWEPHLSKDSLPLTFHGSTLHLQTGSCPHSTQPFHKPFMFWIQNHEMQNHAKSFSSFTYSCDQLFTLQHKSPAPVLTYLKNWGNHTEDAELDFKKESKEEMIKAFYLFDYMGIIRFLANKTDKLSMLVRTQKKNRKCSVFCFYWDMDIPDSNTSIPGFQEYGQTGTWNWAVRRKVEGLLLLLYTLRTATCECQWRHTVTLQLQSSLWLIYVGHNDH